MGGSFQIVRARTCLKAKCIRNHRGKMLRKVIDLSQVEIRRHPGTYKKGLDFDLLVAQSSGSLHKLAIKKAGLRITKHYRILLNPIKKFQQ